MRSPNRSWWPANAPLGCTSTTRGSWRCSPPCVCFSPCPRASETPPCAPGWPRPWGLTRAESCLSRNPRTVFVSCVIGARAVGGYALTPAAVLVTDDAGVKGRFQTLLRSVLRSFRCRLRRSVLRLQTLTWGTRLGGTRSGGTRLRQRGHGAQGQDERGYIRGRFHEVAPGNI
jgi:hypothetical protein